MINRLIAINSRGELSFEATLRAKAEEKSLDFESIDSQDCVLATGFDQTNPGTSILHKGKILPFENTGYYIKSYKDDTHLTYLIGQIVQKSTVLFSDEANLEHSNRADKISMMAVLPTYRLPVPATIICTSLSSSNNWAWIMERVTFPCVVKKSGAKGKKVWKVEDEAGLIAKLNQDEDLTIIQEYLPNDHDFRVFVQDGEVVAAVKRHSADGFYNNISQGGRAELSEINPVEAKDCIAAAQIAGLRVAGVDLLRYQGKHYILEVNKNPQVALFDEVTNHTLVDKICTQIVNRLTT